MTVHCNKKSLYIEIKFITKLDILYIYGAGGFFLLFKSERDLLLLVVLSFSREGAR